MRIPSRQSRTSLRFNVTPLIDIVFLLIIFFLVASHFVRSDNAEPIDLPVATQQETDNPQSLPLVVTITANRELRVRGQNVDAAELERMVEVAQREQGERLEVHLRVDKTVPFRFVEPIMAVCAKFGVTFKYAVMLK
ncbi:ExbD/TolR family protein [Thalassoroseus pseudoceratinae]|uniref:ExbD/TolR family protein n=1 Tax=Thalassoroseus pseudoceratinae TaxID=2713176 RepID=UPI0014217C32|nr:biopolymer transporter ExbD [Thalassoroseus pseudoceratinae]